MLRVRWAVFALNLASVILVVRNASQHVQRAKRNVTDEEEESKFALLLCPLLKVLRQ